MASLSSAAPLLPPRRRPSRPARALRFPPRASTALLTLLASACAPSPVLSAAPPPHPSSHNNNSSASPPTALRTDPRPPLPRPALWVLPSSPAAPDAAPSPAGGPSPSSPRPVDVSPLSSDLALPRLLPCPSPDAR
ncbi:hypothetical protein AB1Y20_012715 [Prymnesium parvum]|uniref:Uncharacterized protein n=1 Tax=Prymnesium parvum TaxID=97485 RepID=A0AB34IM62_PRYPA